MGVVHLSTDFGFLHQGSSYSYAILYVYCDHCGSFKVRKYTDERKWLTILIVCGLVSGSIALMRSGVLFDLAKTWVKWFWAAAILGLIPLIEVLIRLWGGQAFKCRVCGKPANTRYNTRGYPSSRDILDIPDEQAAKLSMGYWTDLLEMDEWIKPPAAGNRRDSA